MKPTRIIGSVYEIEDDLGNVQVIAQYDSDTFGKSSDRLSEGVTIVTDGGGEVWMTWKVARLLAGVLAQAITERPAEDFKGDDE